MGDRRAFDIALSLGPVHGSLDCSAVVTKGTTRKLRVGVDPFLDVIVSQLGSLEVGGGVVNKSLESVAVPFVGVGSAVSFGVVKEKIEESFK